MMLDDPKYDNNYGVWFFKNFPYRVTVRWRPERAAMRAEITSNIGAEGLEYSNLYTAGALQASSGMWIQKRRWFCCGREIYFADAADAIWFKLRFFDRVVHS